MEKFTSLTQVNSLRVFDKLKCFGVIFPVTVCITVSMFD